MSVVHTLKRPIQTPHIIIPFQNKLAESALSGALTAEWPLSTTPIPMAEGFISSLYTEKIIVNGAHIYALCPDKGLIVLNLNGEKIREISIKNSLPNAIITCFGVEKSTIWVGTDQGLLVSNDGGYHFTAIFLAQYWINDLVYQYKTWYIATDKGVFKAAQKAIPKFEPTALDHNTHCLAIAQGHIWAATATHLWQQKGSIWHPHSTWPQPTVVQKIALWGSEMVIGTQNGLWALPTEGGDITPLRADAESANGLVVENILDIFSHTSCCVVATYTGLFISYDGGKSFQKQAIHTTALRSIAPVQGAVFIGGLEGIEIHYL